MLFDNFEDYIVEGHEDCARLDATRVTAHWRTGGTRHMSDLSESPLFGGDKQSAMFDPKAGQ